MTDFVNQVFSTDNFEVSVVTKHGIPSQVSSWLLDQIPSLTSDSIAFPSVEITRTYGEEPYLGLLCVSSSSRVLLNIHYPTQIPVEDRIEVRYKDGRRFLLCFLEVFEDGHWTNPHRAAVLVIKLMD
jgi:hypothetical protein